jgi:hypothetical protein
MKLPYHEGDVFCVPLRDTGCVLGIVARKPRKAKVLLGYFFAGRLPSCPHHADQSGLHPDAASKVLRFGDLYLINGRWRVVGRIEEWDRKSWPMPKFVRRDDIMRRALLIEYADDDPNRVVSEQPCDYALEGYERDAMLGAGAVEIVMTAAAG